MTTHTPAPWHATDDLTIRDNDGWLVASIRNRCESTSSNARLIAAAPELLAAANVLMNVLRDLPKGPQHEAMIQMHHAITKATA